MEETPYMSNIGRENVSNSLYEWQTDQLSSAAANAQLEGDDVASFDAVTATVRLQNYAQISRKTIILSATEEVVNNGPRPAKPGAAGRVSTTTESTRAKQRLAKTGRVDDAASAIELLLK